MNSDVIAKISRIREKANKLIINELGNAGIKGLAPSHGDILAVLFKKDNIPINEIARKISRTKATTTVLIDKLEQAGFLKRIKSDKDCRYTNIVLTEEALKFKPVFKQISEKLNNIVFKNFKEEEIKSLEILLKKISDNLD